MKNCEGNNHQKLNVLKIAGTIDNKHARDLDIENQRNTKWISMSGTFGNLNMDVYGTKLN